MILLLTLHRGEKKIKNLCSGHAGHEESGEGRSSHQRENWRGYKKSGLVKESAYNHYSEKPNLKGEGSGILEEGLENAPKSGGGYLNRGLATGAIF